MPVLLKLILIKELQMKCFVILLLLTSTVAAQDRIFTYTYQSNVLRAGEFEVEPWMTVRWGRESFYRRLDQRLEFETGLTQNLQTAFYLNSTQRSYQVNDSTLAGSHAISFSNEWKYKLRDPVADPFGLALYGEIGIGASEIELESKLIVDKKFEKWVAAFNLVGEWEFEKEAEGSKVETEKETAVEIDLALARRLSSSVYLGLEVRNHNEFVKGTWEHSALFAGPTLSVTRDRFWINATILPQIHAFKGATKNGLQLTDHEKLETRIMFSYAF